MANPNPALAWMDAQLAELSEELQALSAINSGSFNVAGVDQVGERVAKRFETLGAVGERLELEPFSQTDDNGQLRGRPIGSAWRLRQRPDAPLRVFLGGHLDTVFGSDHPFQSVRRRFADELQGPGVADLKGGLLVMWLALAALERSPARERIGWEVLLNPDEEIGSAGSAPLLREAAGRHHFGLVYEPAYADGGLAGARKGSGNFDIVVRGRAAHAGRNPEQGRNAIALAAELTGALHALNGVREAVTVNVGYVHGGGALNMVPDLCIVKFNTRTAAAEDETWLRGHLEKLLTEAGRREGHTLELRGGFTRPPKPLSERGEKLQHLLGDCGSALGIHLQFRPTGGCCDGNNLAAAGLPNVDTLGVVGGDIHTDKEWMRISSLTERAKLSALLLTRLAEGSVQW